MFGQMKLWIEVWWMIGGLWFRFSLFSRDWLMFLNGFSLLKTK